MLTWLSVPEALAQPPVARESAVYPKPGGHVGVAVPVVIVGNDSQVIFSDFFDVGLVPGISVQLDETWVVDFEFIVFDRLKEKYGPPTMVVGPGVIAKLGALNAGLRLAMRV